MRVCGTLHAPAGKTGGGNAGILTPQSFIMFRINRGSKHAKNNISNGRAAFWLYFCLLPIARLPLTTVTNPITTTATMTAGSMARMSANAIAVWNLSARLARSMSGSSARSSRDSPLNVSSQVRRT